MRQGRPRKGPNQQDGQRRVWRVYILYSIIYTLHTNCVLRFASLAEPFAPISGADALSYNPVNLGVPTLIFDGKGKISQN